MSLFIASLNSGSNGNCYYVGNNEEGILIDAGISCREIITRMNALGLQPGKLKAIFITHEHTDHISGLPSLLKKYPLPVYITEATYRGTGFSLDQQFIRSFTAFEPVQVGSLSITAFPKWHDAVDPHSIVISCAAVTVGVFTDIGAPCKNVIHYFKQCHAIFLESNYDEDMLANGRYPIFLKRRISGGKGHLSNKQALQLFLEHRPAFMTHVLLSHLSSQNNSPAIAEKLFGGHAHGTNIIHAPRHNATAVYHITGPVRIPLFEPIKNAPYIPKKKTASAKLQLSLF